MNYHFKHEGPGCKISIALGFCLMGWNLEFVTKLHIWICFCIQCKLIAFMHTNRRLLVRHTSITTMMLSTILGWICRLLNMTRAIARTRVRADLWCNKSHTRVSICLHKQ